MGWVEQLVALVSPRRAYERALWRRAYEEERGYDAGHGGRMNVNWRAVNQSAEQEERYERDLIRARARDLEHNSDVINGVLSAYRRNIVGRGFTLQAATDNEALNQEIDVLWREWCRARNCDVTGQQSFTDLLRMLVQRKKVDGGALLLKRYTHEGLLPFQIQAIELDELDTMVVTPRKKGNRVAGGVEYNAYGRMDGFYIRQYDIDGNQTLWPVYIDAKDVIFWFGKHRPSQIREISDLAPLITRVRDVNEFITAVSVKERIAACLSVFIKRALPAGGLGRSGTNAQTRTVDYAGKRLTPGMITEMNAGDDAHVVDPKGAASDATGFVKLLQRLIGAGAGISYEAASRDMSETNYSSARQGAIEDGLTYSEEIDGLTAVMDEIYETFLLSAVLSGLLVIPDFWENKRRYMRHAWVGTPKPWIDPLKEAQANRIALATAQKTFQQIAAEGGRDWRRVLDDMAEAAAYASEKGIDLGGMLSGQNNAKPPASGVGEQKP